MLRTDGTVATQYETPSVEVIMAVADHEDVDPTELPPLNDVVDPDALDRLFSDPGDGVGSVTFTYRGYRIEVRSDGHLLVRD